MTPTSTRGPFRQDLTRDHPGAARAVSSFLHRGGCDLPLEARGRQVRFVLWKQFSHGVWEIIFRVILAYLRKLARQPRGRSAGATASVVLPAVMVSSRSSHPCWSHAGQRISVSHADDADANPGLTFSVARADVLPKARFPPLVVVGEQVRQFLQHALTRLGCIRFSLCSFLLEQLQETVRALNWNSQWLGWAITRARLQEHEPP